MDGSASVLDDVQLARLHVFVQWLGPLALVAAAVEGGLYVVTRDPAAGLIAVGTFAFAGTVFFAYGMLREGHHRQGVTTVVFASLTIATVYALVEPRAFAAPLAASAIISVISLVYLDGTLRRVGFASATAVGALVLAIAAFVEPPFATPLGVVAMINWAVGTMALGLWFLIVWQFTSRVTETLAETRTARDDLAVANEELLRSAEMKAQFINAAAHQLRTPLTPMMVQLHLMRRRGGELREGSLKVLERNMARLDALVRDLIEAAHLQSGHAQLRSEPVDVSRLVYETVEAVDDHARAAGVGFDLRIAPGVLVLADADRLGRVLENLTRDAVAATEAGRRVEVSVATEGLEALVAVTDGGPLPSPRPTEALFEPFSDGHEDERTPRGMHLYLARSLLARMGGRIWADTDDPDAGLTVRLALPLPRDVRAEGRPA